MCGTRRKYEDEKDAHHETSNLTTVSKMEKQLTLRNLLRK